MQISVNQIKAAVRGTAEVCGTQISDEAIEIMVADLRGNDPAQVLQALARCRREIKGRFTLAEILARLNAGWPVAEIAWAMVNQGEAKTIVWCDEMAKAMGIAQPLLNMGDKYAARQGFEAAYSEAVEQSRMQGKKPRTWVSLGSDKSDREAAVNRAVESGYLSVEDAQRAIPNHAKQLASPVNGIAGLLVHLATSDELSPAEKAKNRSRIGELKNLINSKMAAMQ